MLVQQQRAAPKAFGSQGPLFKLSSFNRVAVRTSRVSPLQPTAFTPGPTRFLVTTPAHLPQPILYKHLFPRTKLRLALHPTALVHCVLRHPPWIRRTTPRKSPSSKLKCAQLPDELWLTSIPAQLRSAPSAVSLFSTPRKSAEPVLLRLLPMTQESMFSRH
jgi:hypothetical protein